MQDRSLIRPYSMQLSLIFRVSDVLFILGSLWTVTVFRGIPFAVDYLLAGIMAGLCFNIFAGARHLYSSWRMGVTTHEFIHVLVAWVCTCGIILVFGFASKITATYSRLAISMWFIVSPLLLCSWRLTLRSGLRVLRKGGYNTKTAVIAGAGQLAGRIARAVKEKPELGIAIKGFYDDVVSPGAEPLAGSELKVLGNLDDMVAEAQKEGIGMVYFALPMRAEKRIREIERQLADTVASVYLVPDFFVFDMVQSRWLSLDGIPLVSLFESPYLGVAGWLKRVEDLLISTGVLAVVVLPMMIIAMGIKLTSKGPVLFKQRRYGLDGREVNVWKFRTMTVCEDGDQISQATKEDPRVTPFGRFLRKTSLDELPQFINVLQGRMSVVGPRPHAVAHNEQYRRLIQGYMRRHKVRPGITGWAQVNGWRGETETLEKMEKRVECDMSYIKNWTLWLDLKIVFLTFLRGFWSNKAY